MARSFLLLIAALYGRKPVVFLLITLVWLVRLFTLCLLRAWLLSLLALILPPSLIIGFRRRVAGSLLVFRLVRRRVVDRLLGRRLEALRLDALGLAHSHCRLQDRGSVALRLGALGLARSLCKVCRLLLSTMFINAIICQCENRYFYNGDLDRKVTFQQF